MTSALERPAGEGGGGNGHVLSGPDAEVLFFRGVYHRRYRLEFDHGDDLAVGGKQGSLVDEPFPDGAAAASLLPGGGDPGVGEPDPGAFQGGFPVGHLGGRHLEARLLGVELGLGRVHLGIGHDFLLVQALGPLEVPAGQLHGGAGLLEVRLGHVEVGVRLDDLLLVFLVVELGDDLSVLQEVADVDIELLEFAGDFGGDDELRLGNERSGEQPDVPYGRPP